MLDQILKKYSLYSRNDFGLPGDNTPEYISIDHCKKAMNDFAEAEATRAQGLVEALDRVKRQCLACGWREEVRDSVINDILKGAEQALNNYNNPVNK